MHTQHYKYTKTGKNREEDLRVARENEDEDDGVPSEQLSHEANEYRNWCKLMELNAMKNIATNENNEGSGGEETPVVSS